MFMYSILRSSGGLRPAGSTSMPTTSKVYQIDGRIGRRRKGRNGGTDALGMPPRLKGKRTHGLSAEMEVCG